LYYCGFEQIDACVSQGSVMTLIKRCGYFFYLFCCKFIQVSVRQKVSKADLTKLLRK